MADDQSQNNTSTQIPPTAPTSGGGLVSGEQQAVPTSNTPSPQADQSNPQPADASSIPSELPDGQQNVQQSAQQSQGDSDGPDNGPNASKAPSSPSATPSNPNSPPPAAVHPAVQKAGLIHDIAQTLAGGPRTTYSIDANTGKMTRTQQPLTGVQIGQAIALAALSGGIAGLGAKGTDAIGRSVQDGAAAVSAQTQERDQQAQQEASQNYARQAAIAQTNFQTHQNALRLSQMEYDYHKQFVDSGKEVLKNIGDVGAAQATGVPESDLTSKYHVTKDMAIADGVVENGKNPDGSTHWENTYTVIDPQKKIALPEETAKMLADLRVPGYFSMKDGKAVPNDFSGSTGIKAGLVVNGLALAQSFQITEAQMNKQLGKLGDSDAVDQFDVNLKKSIADGSITQKGLQTLSGYANMAPDLAVAAMEKDKVDPGVIQQYRKLIPQEAIDKSKMSREDAEAKRKADAARANIVVGKNNYEDILANPKDYGPAAISAAQRMQVEQDNDAKKKANLQVSVAGRSAAASESARLKTEQSFGIDITGKGKNKSDATSNLTHPELADLVQDNNNYNTPNGTNDKFLAGLMKIDPERAKMIQAYSKGMDIQSYYAAVKQFGGSINADIHAYDPSFNASEMRRYDKTIQDWGASGKAGKTNAAASTALEHLGDVYDSYGIGAAAHTSGKYDNALNQASMELSSMYANGNKPGKEEIEHNREALDHRYNPIKGRETAKTAAKEAMDKIEENWNQYNKDLPRGIQREAPLSPKAAAAYKRVTGEDVNSSLVNHNMNNGKPSPPGGLQTTRPSQGSVAPPGATHQQKMSDGHTYPTDASGKILGPPIS